MGVSSQPFPVSLSLKNLLLGAEEDKNSPSSYGYLWSKVLAARGRGMKKKVRSRTQRKVLMKRRARRMEGCRRRAMGIKARIRSLKRLLPNSNSESMGLEGLFKETAEYILWLQMRVRIMQIMVDVLTGSDE